MGDGKHLVLIGTEPGHARRAYVADAAAALRPFSPENIGFEANMLAVARDGRVVLRPPDGTVKIYSVDGHATPVPGLVEDEMPIAWIDDDHGLLVRSKASPSTIDRIDLASGKRERWVMLRPPEPALLLRRPSIVFSRDGRSYAANYQQIVTRLFLVEGLR